MSDLADLFPGFASHHIKTANGHVFAREGGAGEPLFLVHGFPQTHVMWHEVAQQLAQKFRVVAFDLRGYGWSSVIQDDSIEAYAKRAMGEDILAIAEHFGVARFNLAGHDRGARVSYRFALDHHGRVDKLVLLDIIPTYQVWDRMNAETAMRVYHWPFLAQAAPIPETLIGADAAMWQESCLAGWSASKDLKSFDTRALRHYRAFFTDPSRLHATCQDYRAGATIDVAHDRESLVQGKIITCPTLVLWGETGIPAGKTSPLEAWKALAPHAEGHAVRAGHFVVEENPEDTLRAMMAFL
ncbi:MhpC Predicted hydrolases or acyltransferases (alpha/beta hydrolase superfamily) [Rhabdaerophilaceae bacterium]